MHREEEEEEEEEEEKEETVFTITLRKVKQREEERIVYYFYAFVKITGTKIIVAANFIRRLDQFRIIRLHLALIVR